MRLQRYNLAQAMSIVFNKIFSDLSLIRIQTRDKSVCCLHFRQCVYSLLMSSSASFTFGIDVCVILPLPPGSACSRMYEGTGL